MHQKRVAHGMKVPSLVVVHGDVWMGTSAKSTESPAQARSTFISYSYLSPPTSRKVEMRPAEKGMQFRLGKVPWALLR